MKTTRAYNVQIWLGLRKTYSDTIHTIDEVREACDEWVNKTKDCVTITPTEFRYVNGNEPGVVIGFINYPRFPRRRLWIRRKALWLAEELMEKMEQNRVTVTTPFRSYMLENEMD